MAISPFPHHYNVTLAQDGALGAAGLAPIASGPPPQFGGAGGVWSPEELLVGAVLGCLKTTFDAYARRGTLTVLGWRGTGEGVLEKSRTGPAFSVIRLHVDLDVGPGDEERAREVILRAERDCIITAAVKAPVELTVDVHPVTLATLPTKEGSHDHQ